MAGFFVHADVYKSNHLDKIIGSNENKEKKVKDFDAVAIFGDIKEKMSKEIDGMNFEQLAAYLNKTKLRS